MLKIAAFKQIENPSLLSLKTEAPLFINKRETSSNYFLATENINGVYPNESYLSISYSGNLSTKSLTIDGRLSISIAQINQFLPSLLTKDK